MTPTSISLRRRSSALAACLVVCAALAAGCAGPSADTGAQAAAHSSPNAQSVPACTTPPPGELPHAAGSLTQTDTGVYCLTEGQQIDVFLTASSGSGTAGTGWSQITSSGTAVLTPLSSGVLTAPRGVTPGIFLGAVRGTATLSSRLPNGKTWTATVVVQ